MLDPDTRAQRGRLAAEPAPDPSCKCPRLARPARLKAHHIAADRFLQLNGPAQRHQLARTEDREPVAVLGFFHQVRGHQHRHAVLVAQRAQVLPQVDARARIEPGGGLVEQQHRRRMDQPFGELDPPLHAAGKRFHKILCPVAQQHPLQHLVHAPAQGFAAQPIQMALVHQVFIHGQLAVDRARLEHDPCPRPDLLRLPRDVETGDAGAAAAWHHQGRQNAKQRCFAAAVRPQQAEDLARLHREAQGVECTPGAVLVRQGQQLDRRAREGAAVLCGFEVRWCCQCGHGALLCSSYRACASSISRMNRTGRYSTLTFRRSRAYRRLSLLDRASVMRPKRTV